VSSPRKNDDKAKEEGRMQNWWRALAGGGLSDDRRFELKRLVKFPFPFGMAFFPFLSP
jgi:hypothetical protein